MIASHGTVHHHAAGAKGGNPDSGHPKRGVPSKTHRAVGAHGLPVRILVTAGTGHESRPTFHLIEGEAG